jgi:DNA-binding NarL/FixJ family response regulator
MIDDHALVRAGLRMLLESQGGIVVVGEAGQGAEALEIVSRKQPDIILLDLDLSGETSTDCIPALLTAAENARIIVLTGVRDNDLHQHAVRLGAVGLVLKERAGTTLLRAIERVYAGEVWLERTMMASVLQRMTRTSHRTDPEADKIATLTAREREVIALIGEGLRNRQVADRLFISETTVRHHLTSIYDKLDVADRLELVIYAYRHGLITLNH